MKNIAFFIFIILIGCKKKNEESSLPTPYELTKHWGSVSYLINGKNIDTSGIVDKKNVTKIVGYYLDTLYSIEINRFTDYEPHYSRESTGFTSFRYPPKKGIYMCGGNENNYLSTNDSINKLVNSEYTILSDDGDVIRGFYLLDDSKKNTVEITDYDSNTQEIKGVFNVFYKSTRKLSPFYPDTLSITKGIFHTKLSKLR